MKPLERHIAVVDGNRPNLARYMKDQVPQLVNGKPATSVEWKIVAA